MCLKNTKTALSYKKKMDLICIDLEIFADLRNFVEIEQKIGVPAIYRVNCSFLRMPV